MPSERIARRIDSFLDEAELALAENDWATVIARCNAVLALDPQNVDAAEYIAAANRASGPPATATESKIVQAAPSATNDPAPTSFGSGRYTVEKFLGEGGKKRVFLAHDNTLDIDVAVAQIKTDDLNETGRERIRREAQAMARLGTHPNVMPIYDLREENGDPIMVQPLMSGGDVEGLIDNADGPMDLARAIDIGIQTAQGLSFAHAKGIVHRDIKPGNVWLDQDGSVKIGDFGLAVAIDRSRITVEKVMVGTVAYMPPEQATGGDVTSSADIYSLGVMLYEMCSGRVPFMGDDDIGIISQHINTPPVAPSWHNKQIPQSLSSLIMRMLAKDPSERPRSADEVVTALKSVDLTAVSDDSENARDSLESIAGGVFVGRHREMDRLKAMFEEVLGGQGHMVTLVGEPGIGKTRIARELATYATMRGAAVAWGTSYEGGGEPAYWPWVRAIRELIVDFDPERLRNLLGAVAPVLGDLVPDIRAKLPDIPAAIGIEEPNAARFRLFDSVVTFLKTASNQQPIVIMLEDLHWADRPTLKLLEFLARELPNSRLMIVGNYRDVELSRRHPLSITLGELGRERRFERVLLRGLQRHDVERFIEIAAGLTPPAALVDAVYTQTEGNPLFVTETVRLLVQEGDIRANETPGVGSTSWEIRIPEGVREVIGRRLDRLSERCNEILTTGAVIGRQFRFAVLLSLLEDATENMLLDALDEALGSKIIEEMPEEVGLYQFTHALMQETLTSELSANRLVRMHARIAEALEAHYGESVDEHAGELVGHFAEAETVLGSDKMVKYTLQAGKDAAASYAWNEAYVHFQRAITVRDSGGPSSSRIFDEETAGILRQLRLAQSALLLNDEAEATTRRLYEHYVSTGETAEAVAMICETGNPLPDLVEAALELVPDDSHEAGWLLAWHGGTVGRAGDYDAAEDAFYNAMAIAQREADQDLALRIMINSNGVDMYSQQYGDEALEKGLRYVEIARRAGDKSAEAQARLQTGWNGLYVGKPDVARKQKDACEALTDELGIRRYRRMVAGLSSAISRSLGDFDTARSETLAAIEIEQHYSLMARMADLALEAKDFDEASQWILKLTSWVHSESDTPDFEDSTGHSVAVLIRTLAHAKRCGMEDDFGIDALDVVNRGTWDGSPLIDDPTLKMARVWLKVHFEDANDLDKAISDLDELGSIFVAPVADVDHVLGIGHGFLGEHEKAEQLFTEAAERCQTAGYLPALAWTLADHAEMLIRRNEDDDRRRAWDLQTDALDLARKHNMLSLTGRIVATRGHARA